MPCFWAFFNKNLSAITYRLFKYLKNVEHKNPILKMSKKSSKVKISQMIIVVVKSPNLT